MVLCVCGHGAMWHSEDGPCREECDCQSFRPTGILPSDGQHDGDTTKRAEGGGVIISDHPHRSEPAYERCQECGFAESAHSASKTTYTVEETYRCPHCVDRGKNTCRHGRGGALDVDGARLSDG